MSFLGRKPAPAPAPVAPPVDDTTLAELESRVNAALVAINHGLRHGNSVTSLRDSLLDARLALQPLTKDGT